MKPHEEEEKSWGAEAMAFITDKARSCCKKEGNKGRLARWNIQPSSAIRGLLFPISTTEQ